MSGYMYRMRTGTPQPPPSPEPFGRSTRNFDQIRANLVSRGALRSPHHWDQLVREARKEANSAAELVTVLTAKAATLPGLL